MDKHGIGRKLLRLNEELDVKQKEESELKGEYKSLLHRLDKDFSITEGEAIDNHLEGLDENIRTIEEKEKNVISEVEGLFSSGEE